jgi:hypothetical protein
MKPLCAQGGALHDAEAMLLVDHGESELAEGNALLNQRVRADHHVDGAGRELGGDLATFARGRCAGQQREPEPRVFEQTTDIEEVLVGENLRRRHEGNLQAILHRDQRGHQRHNRLSGPHVPLEKAIHRLRTLHVGNNFANRRFLISRELERQHGAHGLSRGIRDDNRARLALGVGASPPQHSPELEQKELFEDQTKVRRRSKCIQLIDRQSGRREMHLPERLTPVNQMLTAANVRGQWVGQDGGQLLKCLMDQHSLHFRRELAGLLINRHNPPGMECFLFDHFARWGFARTSLRAPFFFVVVAPEELVLRALHLQAVRRELEFAEQDDPLVRSKDVI